MPPFKRTAQFFFLLVLILLVDFLYLGRPAVGIDDANIFMNYARHLALGDGFVFNSGGEKVEGFTSLLWVLVCSVFYAVSAHPEWLMMLFLLLLTTLSVSMVYESLRKDVEVLNEAFCRRYFFAVYVIFLICISPNYLAWSVLSLMENGLWNFLFVYLTVTLLDVFRSGSIKNEKKAGLLAALVLLLLTRPEGLAWGVFFGLLLFLFARRYRKDYAFPIVFFVLLSATVILLTAWRERYFGYPLPNTYYAKVSHNAVYNAKEGVKYLVGFLTNFHVLLSFLITLLFLCGARLIRKLSLLQASEADPFDRIRLRLLIVCSMVLAALLLPIATGGDHFGGFRFYQEIFLLTAWGLAALLYLQKTAKKQSWLVAPAVTFLLLTLGSLYNLKNIPQTRLKFEFDIARESRGQADALNALWKDNRPSVGVITAGGFGLRYQGLTVDLMGLNNTIMGHNPGDRIGVKNHAAFNKDVFYDLQPDLILPRIVADARAAEVHYAALLGPDHFDNQAMKNIFNDEKFYTYYQPLLLSKNGMTVFVFAHTSLIARLQSEATIPFVRMDAGRFFPRP